MEIKDQVSLKFNGVSIVDLHYTSVKQYIPNDKNKVGIDIQPKVFYPKESPKKFKILMDIHLESQDHFSIKIFAIGEFELTGELIDSIKQNFISVNAPAIMFPYVRSFISTLTANLGFTTGTIILPPQFFSGNLQEIDEEDLIENKDEASE